MNSPVNCTCAFNAMDINVSMIEPVIPFDGVFISRVWRTRAHTIFDPICSSVFTVLWQV